MNTLAATDLEHFRGRIAAVQSLGYSSMFITVVELTQLLDEVEANRLKIETLAEKCASLREK